MHVEAQGVTVGWSRVPGGRRVRVSAAFDVEGWDPSVEDSGQPPGAGAEEAQYRALSGTG